MQLTLMKVHSSRLLKMMRLYVLDICAISKLTNNTFVSTKNTTINNWPTVANVPSKSEKKKFPRVDWNRVRNVTPVLP